MIFMKVLLVTNAYSYNAAQKNQAERLKEELASLNSEVLQAENFALAGLSSGKITAGKYDCCVFLDKDRVAARMLERSGIRLFNGAQAIEICDDKMLTHIALANRDIPMPDCVYAPLCYIPGQKPNAVFLKKVISSLGLPLVAKTNYGSLGAGVELIKSEEELYFYEERNISVPHFYQQFIDCGCGEDIRAIVIGGKFVCAMKRRNESDFRSNIGLGGKGEKYEADRALKELCERVASILQLDYCGIDILTDKAGKRYICEVNSNAFFAEAERVCGVNIAKKYAVHIKNAMENN